MELIVNIQYACQRHYFGAMAEAYFDNRLRDASVNVRRKQKTYDGFERLPESFTCEDVMRCFNMASDGSARMKISRFLQDHLIEKIEEPTNRHVLTLYIGNDGLPIPAENRQSLFVPFFTTKRSGSGIGLSLSRRMMIQQGGMLDLAENPLSGCRVGFILTILI